MFGITSNAKNQQVSECTPEKLDKALRSPIVAKACAAIEDALEQCRRGEMNRQEFDAIKSRNKLLLPVLTPQCSAAARKPVAAQTPPSIFFIYSFLSNQSKKA